MPQYLARTTHAIEIGAFCFRASVTGRQASYRFLEFAGARKECCPVSNASHPIKLACTTTCLPGSEAERKELERIAEFQRLKAERLEQELREKPERDAQRLAEYEASTEANRMLMRKKRST